jgi:hypothetical protein
MIRVHGVVTRCYPYGCQLYQSADDKSKWLGLGTSDNFDDSVQPFIGKPIIVSGLLRADCLHAYADPDKEIRREDGALTVVLCTDRASMIMDPQLVGLVR